MAHVARTGFMSCRLSGSCRDLPQAKELHTTLGRETEIREKCLAFCQLCDSKQTSRFFKTGCAKNSLTPHRRNARFAPTTSNSAVICVHIDLVLMHESCCCDLVLAYYCVHGSSPALCKYKSDFSCSCFFRAVGTVNLVLIYFSGLIVFIQSQALFCEYSVFLGMVMM